MLSGKDIKDVLPIRKSNSNKGDYGYVAIMGGCVNYSGAIKLANISCASLRTGCGVIRLIVPKSLSNIVAPYLLEQTLFLIDDVNTDMLFNQAQIDVALQKIKALAIGMGWGNGINNEKILKYILQKYEIPIVIDADGLNTLAKMDKSILNETKCKVILTPHLKEFERLSGFSIEEIQRDKNNIVRNFAKKYNVILLLKGPITIVSDGKREIEIDKGCPGMATAGSGDVLSGVLVGLLGYHDASILTLAAGAYISGLAGELAQRDTNDISMIASDTIKHIPEAINKIRNDK